MKECPRCKGFFKPPVLEDELFDLFRDGSVNNEQIMKEYPVQDDVWPGRRWNYEHTEYEDMSGGDGYHICPDCHTKEMEWECPSTLT